MATLGQPLLAPEEGWNRFDHSNSGILYNGSWASLTASRPTAYGASVAYASNIAATASFKFFGTKARIIAYVGPVASYSGRVEMVVDGAVVAEYASGASVAVDQVLVAEVTGLFKGAHEVVLRQKAGATGTFSLDAVEIDPDGYFLNDLQTTIPVIPGGWKRYDDKEGVFKYTGTWTELANNSYYKSSRKNQSRTVVGNTIEFDFIGTRFRVVTSLYYQYSDKIAVTIDGTTEYFSLVPTSGNTSSALNQMLAYEKSGLSKGRHKVKVERVNVGVYSTDFVWDAVDIDADGRMLHPDEVIRVEELAIGSRIRCNYRVTATNTVGVFSGLGQETADFLNSSPTAASPNGDFYFIKVDGEKGEDAKLIADRGLQTAVSWDAINTSGVGNGKGIIAPIPLTVLDKAPSVSGATAAITAQTFYNSPPWQAFDESAATTWYTSTPTYAGVPPEADGYWIQYDLGAGNEFAINYMTLQSLIYSGSSTTMETFILKGSDDGVTFTEIARGRHLSQESTKNVVIENKVKYRYYRLHMRGYGSNGDVAGARNITFERREFLEAYNTRLRLMTGGVRATDKDNEWDKYIVNSSLNGTITPGDNSVWNWSGKSTWTSSTETSLGRRVRRGYDSVGGYFADSATLSNSNSASAENIFRPMLILEPTFVPPKFFGGVDKQSIHANDVTLAGEITDKPDKQVQYRITVNGVQAYPANGYTSPSAAPVQVNQVLPNSLFTLGSNTISIYVKNDEGETSYSYSVSLISASPTITAIMTGMRLDLMVEDVDGDKVQYNIWLNGRQIIPENEDDKFTAFKDSPTTYTRAFMSNEVNVGQGNIVSITARDVYGVESTITKPFMGTYSGIMFADVYDNYYSTDLGEILQYLDIGVLIAGQISQSYPVKVVNKTGYPISNVTLTRDRKTLPEGTFIEISLTESPFVAVERITHSEMLNYEDEFTFYVRIVTQLSSQPGQGEFDVFVKGDPH